MSEHKPMQQCPICGAAQPVTARICSICGAALPGEVAPVRPEFPTSKTGRKSRPPYNPAEGGDDLYIGDLSGRVWRALMVVGVVLALVAGVGLGIMISRAGMNGGDDEGKNPDVSVEALSTSSQPTAPPTSTPRATGPIVTSTPKPTMALPTVTTAPPTPTETPTPGPCYQTAQQGDTVWGMAVRCGHRDMAVVDLILQMNDMKSANELQINQTLEIPWPTPTPGAEPPADSPPADAGASLDTGQPVAEAPSGAVQYNEFGTPDALAQYQNVEPTLRPGLAWHSVQSGEDILSIAFQYQTDVETLSKINPEVEFLQCDYGQVGGGPNCSVMIYPGQRVRVPVPLPTPTLSPTPVGTLTPTPTPTATFNAPYMLAPEDGTQFKIDQIVTLRWGGTGVLGSDERYLVRVTDLDANKLYTAVVREMSYIIPGAWQPAEGDRHTFEWAISVVTVDAANNIIAEDHLTVTRKFFWESR